MRRAVSIARAQDLGKVRSVGGQMWRPELLHYCVLRRSEAAARENLLSLSLPNRPHLVSEDSDPRATAGTDLPSCGARVQARVACTAETSNRAEVDVK